MCNMGVLPVSSHSLKLLEENWENDRFYNFIIYWIVHKYINCTFYQAPFLNYVSKMIMKSDWWLASDTYLWLLFLYFLWYQPIHKIL